MTFATKWLDRRRRRRRGVSLFDFVLYLSLAAVVFGGAILAYNNLENRQKRLQTSQLVTEIFTAVADLHRTGASYGTGDLIPTLEAAKRVPSKGRSSVTDSGGNTTTTITSPFGDNVTVVGAGTTFTVTVVDMTEANCIDLLTNYADQGEEESALAGVAIESADQTLPLSVATISSTCDADSDVALTFR
ncbi:MAG: type 4 pilus major pilin [Rhodospirillales bacterium]|nr:type 4 pilus major pilin [Rhodospirillales bacterium]